ncbi:general secretion pathway protein G [Natronospira proteinivora]|uniref:General secretion pathway protein G n=1 Tax=Natronospira proteinivora TaxID=1807133 RepID=A0ABT1G9T2_9GAMM|nr:prepilin-type N-terminal cleavage/methylation domain-containing protein [Natronospira proteinivora]MCP1728090.1 general secretion pathway protein G [Natronospira proteinivora]
MMRTTHVRQSGVTLIELVVVITLVIVLVATAIENLLPLAGEAERVAVERNRVAVDTALRGEAAQRLLGQGREAVMDLEGHNPVSLLARPPANYLGERANADPAEIPPAHWVWDPARQALIYRVRHSRYFHSEAGEPAHIRFQLAREGSQDLFGLYLRRSHDYHWETDGSELARWLPGGAD